MQRQGSFAEAEYGAKKKQTRRDRFLADMNTVVPPAFARAGSGAAGRAPCPALSERRARAAADWVGTDAAGLFCAAMVRVVR